MERCSKDNKSERSLDQGSHLGCESGTGNACEQPGWSCRAMMRLELLFPGLELDGHDREYHNMYTVSKPREPSGDVVLLRTIRQACQLIPTAPRKEMWPLAWMTQNVLDLCNSFLLNNWASKYTYQTLW